MTGPRSLVEMCMKVAIDNAHLITSLGTLPQEYAMEILRAVKTSSQLHTLELNSDDIYDLTQEHWKRIIKKDFPILSAKYNYVPKDPKSWHKVWRKYKALQDQADAAATEKLRKSIAAKQEERDSRRATIISMKESRKMPRPKPRGSRSWSSQPREKPTFLQKARKEMAVESNRFKPTTSTGKVPAPASQITKAPAAMINIVRIERQFDPTATRVRAPRKKANPDTAESESERKRREARLLQIKTAAAPNVVSFSDDEEDNEADDHAEDDDLFGDLETDRPPRRGALSPRSLEEMATSSSSANKTIPLPSQASKQSTKARRGFLSASPGANGIVKKVLPPQNTSAGSMPSPVAGSAPPSLASARSSGPPRTTSLSVSPPLQAGSTSPAPQLQLKRSEPVDIFMRPNKRPRR
ncbi:hypothetical protein VTK56DRAFT_4744 [Thermocarpiscus australiensis]